MTYSLPDSAIVREPRVSVLSRPAFVEPAHRRVAWNGASTEGEQLTEYAERVRTGSHHNPAGRETRDYLRGLATPVHGSALEHAHYSLLIEGVSRALTHELQRHGAEFALTEAAPRHVDINDTQFVVPPAIIGNAELEAAWLTQVSSAMQRYTALVDDLMTRYAWIGDKVQRRRLARDAAFSVLPNATASTVVLSGSVSAWRTLLAAQCAEHTELELRRLAVHSIRVLSAEAPACFDDFEFYLASDRHEAARRSTR